MWKRLLPMAALAVVMSLAACGGDEASAIPPAPTVAATAALGAPATPTTVPPTQEVAAVVPTLPPPPTAVIVPTEAPPTPVVTPEPEQTGTFLAKPEDFANRNPFTGEVAEDPSSLNRRPITVKLSNAPADYTRPQAGLNDADMIFEHWTEGSVTRFTALFYDTIPPNVGPIRSARLIDLELPAMYDAMLAFSGASVGVNQRLNASDFSDRLLRATEPGFYRTGDETKPFEHTLYIRLEDLWKAVQDKGLNTPPRITTYNSFTSEAPEGGTPANTIKLDMKTEIVEWRYDPETGKYLRWMDNEEHVDANTGEQVAVSNVVVLSPLHVNDPTICEQINNGVCAALSIQIQLWGGGIASVFRDGKRYDVVWEREGRNDMLTFRDFNDNPFPLQIGNTWVQIVPSFMPEALTSE